ncbi:gremlin-1-like [Hydractinia symbiolongicarpus]|uniref:gremlin-1-like n=1 Tax=Hydractinia symbiolongicarpus TaxID=13093 RepID=UPI00254E7D8F|nr:gremlin-1-like [Hydractinia symbiolongicarpus]
MILQTVVLLWLLVSLEGRQKLLEPKKAASEVDSGPNDEICKALNYNLTVIIDGCIPVVMPNKICYGSCQCISTHTRYLSCRQCWPKDFEFVRVRMRCPGRRKKRKTTKVLKIISCRCQASVMTGK